MNFKHKIKTFLVKHNILKQTFNVEGFVYVDKNKKAVNDITDTVKWLGDVNIYCRYKDINKNALDIFNSLYPQYIGIIKIF